MEKCILCKKELKGFEEDVCETCLSFLQSKYPRTKCLQEVIKWHKKFLEENPED